MELQEKNVLFLDLQTTGAKPGAAHILEVAWSSAFSEEIESYLVQQPDGQLIPSRIQKITGIDHEAMVQARAMPEILDLLKAYLAKEFREDVLAVIHFAQFEKSFLQAAFDQVQENVPFSILCTHEIAKRLMPNLPSRGIKGLAGYFGFSSGEFKRAASHVQATRTIWRGLTSALAEKKIQSLGELQSWLRDTPQCPCGKWEYPLAKERRLSLPEQPGIYRMLGKGGGVLYVGKATNLNDRVNSYFRGKKNRDSRKLEMLTQVWDISVTPVGSPIEAALLETDEIKRLDPPYNISLKTGHRILTFFNHDFTSLSDGDSDGHHIGPFSNPLVLDSILRLSRSIQTGSFDERLFFEPIEPSLLQAGFSLFCQRHQLNLHSMHSVRSILAIGLRWVRQTKNEAMESHPAPERAEGESEWTPEEIADKFERHFIRAAKAYRRTKKLNELLNADVRFEIEPEVEALLRIRQGRIAGETSGCSLVVPSWKKLSIDTYDRMTVLLAELDKLRSQKRKVRIHFHRKSVNQ